MVAKEMYLSTRCILIHCTPRTIAILFFSAFKFEMQTLFSIVDMAKSPPFFVFFTRYLNSGGLYFKTIEAQIPFKFLGQSERTPQILGNLDAI